MAEIYKCDICERTSDEAKIEHYQLKKKVCSWCEFSWEYLDICTECIEEIRNKFENKRKRRYE